MKIELGTKSWMNFSSAVNTVHRLESPGLSELRVPGDMDRKPGVKVHYEVNGRFVTL